MTAPRTPTLSRRAVLTRWGAVAGGPALGSLLQACAPAGPSAPPAPPVAPPTTGAVPPQPTAAGVAAPVSPPTTAPAAPQPASAVKTLQFAEATEPKSYDGVSGSVLLARQGIGQTLVRIGFDGKIEPALATQLEPVDATTWRFTLREGVKFHNGAPLDAQAVKASLERLAGLKDSAQGLQGAVVTSDSPTAGRIQTRTPVAYLPALLADGAASILDRGSYGADAAITRPVGTGPFEFVEWRPGDRVVLQAHEGYWGGTPKLQNVEYRFVSQAQTRSNLVRSGEVDIANVIPATDVPVLQKATGVSVLTNPSPRLRALYINTQNGPTSDVRVRRALAHATDREIIVKTVLENQGTAQAALFRAEYPWSNPNIKGLPFDRERAKALLAEAGYTQAQPLTLTLLTYNLRAELPLIAQVLQQQWAAVGINCDISIQDYSAIETTAFKEGTHNLALFSRSPLLVYDPQAIFETDFSSTGSYNLSRYSGLDAKIKAAGSLVDTDARYSQYREIEQHILEDDVAAIVISAYINIDGVRAGVTGYRQHPTELLALTETLDKS